MSTITLTGLTEIERARLRYALVLDEETSYEDDPFVDDAMELDISLSDLVVMLTTIRDALYEPEVPRAKAPSTLSGVTSTLPRPEKKLKKQGPYVKKTTSRKNLSWKGIASQIRSGEIDNFTHLTKRAAAKSARAMLLTNYPDIDVAVRPIDSELSEITLKLAQ